MHPHRPAPNFLFAKRLRPGRLHLPRATTATLAALSLSACASLPTTVPHRALTSIHRVGIVSLLGDEMHAYFKVGPVIRQAYIGPPLLKQWHIEKASVAAARGALAPRYRYVPLRYNPGDLEAKGYRPDRDRLNLGHIKADLRRLGEGKVDAIIVISTSGSVARVVGRKAWLAGYGFYRQSFLPGSPTVDYAAISMTVVSVGTQAALAANSGFTYRRLPAGLWTMNIMHMTAQQEVTLRTNVSNLVTGCVRNLVRRIGLGKL